jgi:putative PIG3 family NAD(P)H quinone oxidoreductase
VSDVKAVVIHEFGDASVLRIADVDLPEASRTDVVIDVAAAGVNRADVQQREGHYPPPPGSPQWPGLEVSGTIAAVGDDVTGFAVGDPVCALIAGGGYAERVVVPAAQVLPVPDGVDLVDAAGLVEVVATVWANVFLWAELTAGETLLAHGGSSGIGTMAVQLGRAFGARVAVTAGSREKLDACAALGADILIDYKTEDFVERMKAEGGADVILDVVGASYLDRNVQSLAMNGRIANIGSMGGRSAEFNLGALMAKRGTVHSAGLRARPPAEKAEVIASVRENVWPLVANGTVRPVIGARFAMADAADAHRLMESSAHIGKILLVN